MFRTDKEWDKLFVYAKDVANVNEIDTCPVPSRQRRPPPHLENDFITTATGGTREHLTISVDYKVNLYFPVLDAFLAELNSALVSFSQKNINLMRSISSLCPKTSSFLNPVCLKPLASTYDLDYDALCMESILASRTLVNTELETLGDVLRELLPLKSAFPTLVKAVQIAMTICVSTAKCERSFSALDRIKTYLRSTMTEQRLTDLAILSIEKELAGGLSLEAVVNEFASNDKNRRIVLF